MDGLAQVRAALDGLETDLSTAASLLAPADAERWSSPAARAYRARLDDLRGRVTALATTARLARGPVLAAFADPVPCHGLEAYRHLLDGP